MTADDLARYLFELQLILSQMREAKLPAIDQHEIVLEMSEVTGLWLELRGRGG